MIVECKSLNLTQYKALFIVVTAVLALLVASPALQRVLVYPRTEFFTELSLLGPAHTAENYPYNVTNGENYTVFLGIGNQLGACAYYQIEVKFRNETQSAPDNLQGIPSNLTSLDSLKVFVADQESLEIPVNFGVHYSFQNVTRTIYTNVTVPGVPSQNSTVVQGAENSTLSSQNATVVQKAENITLLQANFDSLNFNGETLSLQGASSDWNPKTNVFYGNLVFELWIYNSTISSFQYHARSVDLKLNMTTAGLAGAFGG